MADMGRMACVSAALSAVRAGAGAVILLGSPAAQRTTVLAQLALVVAVVVAVP